jgi:hypothetical protein
LLAINGIESLIHEGAENTEEDHPGGYKLGAGHIIGHVDEGAQHIYHKTNQGDQVRGDPLKVVKNRKSTMGMRVMKNSHQWLKILSRKE